MAVAHSTSSMVTSSMVTSSLGSAALANHLSVARQVGSRRARRRWRRGRRRAPRLGALHAEQGGPPRGGTPRGARAPKAGGASPREWRSPKGRQPRRERGRSALIAERGFLVHELQHERAVVGERAPRADGGARPGVRGGEHLTPRAHPGRPRPRSRGSPRLRTRGPRPGSRTRTPSASKLVEAPVRSDIIHDLERGVYRRHRPAHSSGTVSSDVAARRAGRLRQGRHDRGTRRPHRGVAGHAGAARITSVQLVYDLYRSRSETSRRVESGKNRSVLSSAVWPERPPPLQRGCHARAGHDGVGLVRGLRGSRGAARRRAPRGPRRGSRPLETAAGLNSAAAVPSPPPGARRRGVARAAPRAACRGPVPRADGRDRGSRRPAGAR